MPIISNFPGGSGNGQLKISSISVTTPPAKTTYRSGESFDPTGMVVTADYGYGLTAPVTGYEVTPSVLTDEVTAVTVSYTENRVTKTTTQAVTVTPILASIAVTTNPAKMVYSYLEQFDPSGMVVTATMTDGSTHDVSGYTSPETAFTTLGSQSVPITYTEDGVTKSTSLTVTVNAIQVAAPVQSNSLRYTGSTLAPEWTGYDSTKMSISGDTSGIDTGTYSVTFTTIYGYTFLGGTTVNVDWTIGRQILPGIPAQSNALIADGTTKTPTFSNYDPDKMDISGDTSGTAAGDYDAGFTPKANYEWPDGTHETKTVTWTITDVQVPIPSQINVPTYDGNPKTPEWTNADMEHSTVSVSAQVNAGDYTATWSLTAGMWSDGTTADKTIPWSIRKATPTVTAPTAKSLTYDGTAQALVNAGSTTGGTLQYSADNTSWSTNVPTGTAAGSYTVYYRVVGGANYNDDAGGNVSVTIGRATISAVPSQANTLTYNGNVQNPTWSNYDSVKMTLGGVTSGTDAGSYAATFTPTFNYKWSDNSTTAKTVNWSINIASVTIPTATGTSKTYDGTLQGPTVSNYNSALMTQSGTASAINAGSYSITYALSDTTNYQWSDGTVTNKSISWSIGKAAGSASASPSSVTLSSSATSASVTVNRAGDGAITATSSDESICTASVSGNTVTIAAPTMATKAAGDFSVGDIVYLNENGSPAEYIVVHQGLPSSIYDSSCNGTWLLRKDIYENRAWHSSNVNDYANSTIHSYLNSTFLGLLDADIQAQVKQVKLPYRSGSGYATTVTSGSSGLSAKIFLLSGTEVSMAYSYIPVMGAELSYFAGCADTGADSKRVANLNGSAAHWWLRCPYCYFNYGATYASYVSSSGGWGGSNCSNSFGIRPALVLPSTTTLSGPADPQSGTATVTINVAEGSNHTAASTSVGVTAQFGPSSVLNDNSWDVISEYAAEGANYWAVGDTKTITINGTVGTYTFSNLSVDAYILGFNHNSAKEGANRIHFQLGKIGGVAVAFCDSNYDNYKDDGTKIFNVEHWGSRNYGGWAASDMRYDILGSTNTAPSGYGSAKTTYSSGTDAPENSATSPKASSLMAALPSDLRAVMKAITKYTDNTAGGSDTARYVVGITDFLFNLAEFEVFGGRYFANSAERNYQLQYDYYKNGNSKVAYNHSATSTAVWWWLRSPGCDNSISFCNVHSGGSTDASYARTSGGLRPGFAV